MATCTANLPANLDTAIGLAWQKCRRVPGFLGENEARFLGLLAAATPAHGAIVEIGSFKGKSTVMLASVAASYQMDPIVAIDPHTAPSTTDPELPAGSSTYDQFLSSIRAAELESHVEVLRSFSREAAKNWNRPIRLLWIDGDHTYKGVKEDFDGFLPHLAAGGIVAFHDALTAFQGPIRIFVDDVLRSDRFGAAGFVHSIAWAQFRPVDGKLFVERRLRLARTAARLLPFVAEGRGLSGLRKILYKLNRSRVPRAPISPADWAAKIRA